MSSPVRHAWLLVLVVLGAAFVAFFHAGLFHDRQFLDRDTAHFYYPLFWYERAEIHAGRVPLWNPLQNAGQPLAANPVASVFYAPKLLVYCLPYSIGFKLFLLAHFAWALAGAYRLGRVFGMGRPASTVVALVYAFNGHVLYQIANVPFLISASWLPWFLGALDRLASPPACPGAFGAAVGVTITLAMMILAGDPQLAHGCVMLAPVWLFVCGGGASGMKRLGRSIGWPAAISVVCALLVAVQVLLTMELELLSTRSLFGLPENWWHYSFHPCRTIELIAPWFFGHQWPVHSYWGEALFDTTGLWTPSAYMGATAVLLAVAAFTRRPERRDWLLLGLLVLGLAIAFGKFCPVYEWLANWAPGASSYRYPSKHIIWVALALAVLAGRGSDRVLLADGARPMGLLTASLAASVLLAVGLGVFMAGRSGLADWAAPRVQSSVFYGPFSDPKAMQDTARALSHALGASCVLLFISLAAAMRARVRILLLALPLVTFADLWLANRDLVVAHRPYVLHRPPARPLVVGAMRVHQESLGRGVRFDRLYRPVMLVDRRNSRTSSPDRLRELFEHDVALLENKNGMIWGVPQAFSDVTLGLASHRRFMDSAGVRFLDLVGAAYVLAPAQEKAPPGWMPVEILGKDVNEPLANAFDAKLWFNPNAYPRAWFEAAGERDPKTAVDITDYESAGVTLSLAPHGPGRVVLADTRYPGWRATLDGEPVEIERAHISLRAIPVGPGKHTIEMRYEPAMFAVGAWTSGVAWVGLVIVWVVWRVRRRGGARTGSRRSAAPSSASDGDRPDA